MYSNRTSWLCISEYMLNNISNKKQNLNLISRIISRDPSPFFLLISMVYMQFLCLLVVHGGSKGEGGMGVATCNILSHHPLRIFENKSVIIKQNKNEMNMCMFAYWFTLYKHGFLQLIRNLSDSYHCFHDLILARESQSTYPIENMEFLGTSWYYGTHSLTPSPPTYHS